MEVGGSKTQYNFTFMWSVNNFCLESVDTLESRSFTANSICETKWRLILSVPDLNSAPPGHITCTLQRERDQTRNENICIDFQISIMDKKAVLRTVKVEGYNFGMNSGNADDDSYQKSVNILKVDTLMEDFGKWLPDNALTLRCQISKPGCNNQSTELCFARTIMNIEKRSFVWTIQDIWSISPKANRIVEIPSHNKGSSSILLILSLEKINGEEAFKIEMYDVKDLKRIYCEISNIDCEGKCVKTWKKSLRKVTFNQNKCVLFRKFLKKEELIENQTHLLTSGALILRCDFQLSFGDDWRLIENYPETSYDFGATSENEECLVM